MKFDKVVHSGLVFEIFPAFSEIQVYNDDGRWNGYKQYQYHNIILYIKNQYFMFKCQKKHMFFYECIYFNDSSLLEITAW